MWKLKEKNGVKYYQIEEFARTNLVEHCFTTRIGGVSTDSYASLNLGLHVDDKKEDVLENRKRICKVLKSDYKELVAGEQVHREEIKIVTEDDKGRGALDYETAIEETDALLTNRKGILLTSYYADCTPILLLDPVKEVIGLAHAGWKGTVKKIAQKAALKMKEVYGTYMSNLLVGIGPNIGKDCYLVDEKVIKPVRNEFSWDEELFTRVDEKQWKFDLSLANRVQLEEIGVKAEKIITSQVCTFCCPEYFFSYRRDKGKTGRMASLIKLK